MLEIVHDGRNCASHHMEVDRKLLQEGASCPRLRLYEWSSFCCTHGLFIRVEDFVHMEVCRRRGVEIASRPTGGGIIFHQNDVAFSLFIPSHYPLYDLPLEELSVLINGKVLEGLATPFLENLCTQEKHDTSLESLRFCMGEAHMFDLVWEGKKVGGCAFRKRKTGVLCQTSLFVGEIPWKTIRMCIKKPHLVDHMQSVCVSLSLSKECAKKVICASVQGVFL